MAERFLVVDRLVDGQVRELFSTDVGLLPVELLEEDDHLHVRIGDAPAEPATDERTPEEIEADEQAAADAAANEGVEDEKPKRGRK